MRRRLLSLAAATVALGGLSTSASAQTAIHRSASATSGKPARIGVLATLNRDCSSGPAPEVKVLTSPKHGALIIRSGKMKTNRIKQCPGLEAPVKVVIYQSSGRFQGSDVVSYEVRNAAGKTQTYTVTINVNQMPAPPEDDDKIEL